MRAFPRIRVEARNLRQGSSRGQPKGSRNLLKRGTAQMPFPPFFSGLPTSASLKLRMSLSRVFLDGR